MTMMEAVSAGAQAQEESAEDAGVAQQHQLMHQEMVSAISEHANDRKFAAKNAQVGLLQKRIACPCQPLPLLINAGLCCCAREGAGMHLLQDGLACISRLPLWACAY